MVKYYCLVAASTYLWIILSKRGNMIYREYDEFIAETEIFDDINKSLDKIQKELSDIITDNIEEEKKRLLVWEGQLFICCEIPLEQRSEDQQFLFPQAVYTNGLKIPDIDNFEAERLDFYKHRLEVIKNVPAKIRYANYCFQYCEKGQKYKYAMQICQLLCEYLMKAPFGHECIVSFSRLFELGLSFSNKDIIQKLDGVVEELISLDYSQEDYLYLLSISRIVVGNILKNKNDFIKAETQEKFASIIEEMSDYYFRNGDYSLYRNCCPNYMDWLKILKRRNQIDAVLLKIGESYTLDANKEGNSNLVKAEFYRLAAKHYVNIGEREKVYHLKVKLKNAFKDAESSGEFETISTTQSVSLEQLEKETEEFFKENIEDTFETVSHSSDFIINKEKIMIQAIEQAKNPLYKLVDFGYIEGNRKVFSTQDNDDVIKHFMFQNYGIELEVTFSTVVNFIWNKMLDMGLAAHMVISRICDIEYMDETQKEIIAVGINRFFENDYVSALHILVPQFESYFRTFFEWGGFPTTSLKSNGLQHEQNFNDFLRQDFVREVLDENLLFMIEFVMVEQLGKNLRNNIAHGLSDIKVFRKNNCLMVVYLFCMITAIKWVFPSENID